MGVAGILDVSDTLPGDTLVALTPSIQEIAYRETKHYVLTRDFLNSPERFFKHLFGTAAEEGRD